MYNYIPFIEFKFNVTKEVFARGSVEHQPPHSYIKSGYVTMSFQNNHCNLYCDWVSFVSL